MYPEHGCPDFQRPGVGLHYRACRSYSSRHWGLFFMQLLSPVTPATSPDPSSKFIPARFVYPSSHYQVLKPGLLGHKNFHSWPFSRGVAGWCNGDVPGVVNLRDNGSSPLLAMPLPFLSFTFFPHIFQLDYVQIRKARVPAVV